MSEEYSPKPLVSREEAKATVEQAEAHAEQRRRTATGHMLSLMRNGGQGVEESSEQDLERLSSSVRALVQEFGKSAILGVLNDVPSSQTPEEDDGFVIEPYDDNRVIVTSKETGAQNIIPNKPLELNH